ncbi:MAG: acetate--CoA ligase family protein [Smithellaceae bacterium]|nr:acetate--CoA ligase family protein [Smithellaceae bacterium]
MIPSNADILIRRVRAEGRQSMTEMESKKLLASYGIPVARDRMATSEREVILQAQKTGYPVVVKGHGAKLQHKTERGLVKTNLKSAKEVRDAFRAIRASAGDDGEGCIVSPQIAGSREWVAGLIRDAQFGPVVMFGLGGIFTEALADTTFRVAPLDRREAKRMIGEIASRKLLGNFRGEAPVDADQLADVLIGLSKLGMERPDIREVDVNPLITTPKGNVVAVDALVILDENPAASAAPNRTKSNRKKQAEIRAALDVMANAQSVAVVGATRPAANGFSGMFGCMRNFGYRGRLYPVNPRLQEIDGIKAYPNLSSLPEVADLVILSIPAPRVADILRECVVTGHKNIHIFSSGFKETGEEEGIRLQREIEAVAREGDLRVIGPNCMGFYVPKNRMLTWENASTKNGPVSLISQSGGNAQDFSNYLTDVYDIGFAKSISYGNALTLDSTDFLDYLAGDEETRIITMYLEGVKDGRLLLDQVKKINRRKPVIIYKSGLTESGARAVSSHTGSLAGGETIWKAFFRQTGAVRVESLEEMADVTQAFHRLGKVRGKRVAVLGFGGGNGVSVADDCAKAGLELPVLSDGLIRKLRKHVPPAGSMIRNPIDAAIAFVYLPLMGEVLDVVARSGEIDHFIVSVPFDWLYKQEPDGAYIETLATYLATEAGKYAGGKPMLVAWRQYEASPKIRRWIPVFKDILIKAGIPVYEGLPKAVRALSKMAEYYEFQGLAK